MGRDKNPHGAKHTQANEYTASYTALCAAPGIVLSAAEGDHVVQLSGRIDA